LFEAPLEALDASARVDELLLPRVERVACGTDLDVQLGLGRARRERVAATAVHGRQLVLGMDLGLHRRARIAAAVWAATLPPETRSTGFLASILPASHAAVAAAPAGSQASFARSYNTRNACSISSSVTSTCTGSPASSALRRAVLVSGSTAITRVRSPIAVCMPPIRPPPPTGTTTASASGASSSSSRPTVPAPASTSGSSNG